MHQALDDAAANGVPSIITLAAIDRACRRRGRGQLRAFLNRVKAHAEDKGVNICMELLNSKVNHKDYMFDHVAGAWR